MIFAKYAEKCNLLSTIKITIYIFYSD